MAQARRPMPAWHHARRAAVDNSNRLAAPRKFVRNRAADDAGADDDDPG